jgi:hypothetical protein
VVVACRPDGGGPAHIRYKRTYDQQRSYNRRIGVFSAGGGLVVTVVCGAVLAVTVRRRRATSRPMASPSGQQ